VRKEAMREGFNSAPGNAQKMRGSSKRVTLTLGVIENHAGNSSSIHASAASAGNAVKNPAIVKAVLPIPEQVSLGFEMLFPLRALMCRFPNFNSCMSPANHHFASLQCLNSSLTLVPFTLGMCKEETVSDPNNPSPDLSLDGLDLEEDGPGMGPNEGKIQTLLKEFLTTGDVEECKHCISELKDGKSKSKFVEVVYQLIAMILEAKEDKRAKV
jgi:hypothetical protein